jgi:hypothetical protein
MRDGLANLEALNSDQRVDAVVAAVLVLLDEMGVHGASPDSVITAPRFYKGPVLFEGSEAVDRFILRFTIKVRFVGYQFNDVAFLTVRQLSALYLRGSYPEIPTVPLADDQVEKKASWRPKTASSTEKHFPICFVLGCPRSGTTLLRAMLDVHEELWAPGELHLANFASMGDRAENVRPVLRYMPLPEIASRYGEAADSVARAFRGWELEDLPIPEVYERLHLADPAVMIVDKTPSYGDWYENLERIGRHFPNARFVNLVRSPHDVIRSLVRMQLYKGASQSYAPGLNPYQLSEAIWLCQNDNIERFLAGVPGGRQCTVRYEELVAAPEEPLTRICDLLDVPFDAAMTDPYRGGRGRGRGRVARGAGDVNVHFFTGVENRPAGEPFFPLGARSRNLAGRLGYRAA